MTTLAVVGVGGWGKNLARNYHQISECNLKYICDLDQTKLDQLKSQVPGTIATTDFGAVLRDPEIEAVVIATPAPSHYALCKQAIQYGKDVYVEKPFVLEVAHAEELIELAARKERILMVGHLLEYHPVVNRLRELIQNNELGEI
ncbi:MAG TPA: Gfo/Idh/MocA family oxidoreductase, partial [Burkholderiaceae bacterium]|nr:Gfo/Idh/MocA family oxidoreductase [Burkholderiaceae bacterium]